MPFAKDHARSISIAVRLCWPSSVEWFKKTLLSKKNSAPPVLYPEKFAEHDGTNIKAIHADPSSLNVKM